MVSNQWQKGEQMKHLRHFGRHILPYGIIFVLSVLLFLKTQTHTVTLRSLLIDAGLIVAGVVALVAAVNWLLNKAMENNNARVEALELPPELLLERADTHGALLLAAGILGFLVSAYNWSQADVYHQYFTWPFISTACLLLAAIGAYEVLRAARRLALSAKRQVWLDKGEYAFYIFNLGLITALPSLGYCLWNPESDTVFLMAEIGLFFSCLSYLLLLGTGIYNCSRFWWTWLKINRSSRSFLEHNHIKA